MFLDHLSFFVLSSLKLFSSQFVLDLALDLSRVLFLKLYLGLVLGSVGVKADARFDGVGCVPVAIGVEKGNCT